jgi:DNA polymerase III subunit delta
MLYFYYGENTYFLSQKKIAVKEKAKEKKFSLAFFDSLASLKNVQLNQFFSSDDFFSKSKVLIFSDIMAELDFNKAKDIKETLKKLKKSIHGSQNQIYFFESNPQKQNPLFLYLRKEADKSLEIKLPKGKELENFLEKETENLGIKIKTREIAKLCFFVNYQLWPAINELKKLNALKKGGEITLEDLENSVSGELVNDIFKTIDALGRKDKKTALSLLQNHLETGDNPLYLLAMFVYQFRNLIKVKSALEEGVSLTQIPHSTKMHPFVVHKMLNFSSGISLDKLKALYKKLADLDYSIKRGTIEANSALDLFVSFS